MARQKIKLTIKPRAKPRNPVARNPLLKKGGAHRVKQSERPAQKRTLKKILDEEV
jgi:hypothetical protein